MKKYQLTVNEEQASIIRLALDVYSRLHSGQWAMALDYIFRHTMGNTYKKLDEKFDVPERFRETKSQIGNHKGDFYVALEMLKSQIMDLRPNEQYGISSEEVPNAMRTAYDIYQVIRKAQGSSKHRSVMQFDEENPLPTANVKDIKEEGDNNA